MGLSHIFELSMDMKLYFFTPNACLEKEDWKWDDEPKNIYSPLSKDLYKIDARDADYDFSVYGGVTEKEEVLP